MVRFITCFSMLCILTLSVDRESAGQEGPTVKPASEMTISEIMIETNKKPARLLKKVATGGANDAEKQRLVDLYKAMQNLQPPRGEADSWSQKTGLLVAAAEAAKANNAEAKQMLTKAANCKACHDLHKEN